MVFKINYFRFFVIAYLKNISKSDSVQKNACFCLKQRFACECVNAFLSSEQKNLYIGATRINTVKNITKRRVEHNVNNRRMLIWEFLILLLSYIKVRIILFI